MTVLTDHQQRIFADRYALKGQDGTLVEHTIEELWDRVARGIADAEYDAEQATYWAGEFRAILEGFRFLPAGRILSGAGSPHAVTFYNCFSGDTPVHVRQGMVPIGTLRGTHEVLGIDGVYRRAEFASYGEQELWEVTLSNGDVLRATADHRWFVTNTRGGNDVAVTRDLRGRHIPINPGPRPARDEDFAEGVRHGIVFGDGSVQGSSSHVCLFGEKEALARWFEGTSSYRAGGTASTREHLRIGKLPATWKSLPDKDASASYWHGFVSGLLATDGHVDSRGTIMIHNADPAILATIAAGMAKAGFVASSVKMTREFSPYDGSRKPVYRLGIFKASVVADDILREDHRANFLASPAPGKRRATVRVLDARPTGTREEVFCCVEPETHSITVGLGYLTSQCYVIPQPEDSRDGIIRSLGTMTEIMARGGGVGINFSSLRPRGSYIASVNGTASGPVSWMELFSTATGRVIQQGGTRRGALMAMLDDDHPDILEFIRAKEIDPLTGRPKAIEHANVSVCVSDAFMEAVKADGEWRTQFPTKADAQPGDKVIEGQTYRAREIWDAICERAWATAEPGVVFIDRGRARSNTWYYEDIRCVNPCGEQLLPEWGVCNLGHMNLSAYCAPGPDGTYRFDLPALERDVKVAMRFLDNVIDATGYFIEENRIQQMGTRRTGLGTTGLADALIKLGLRYGSPEATLFIEKVYRAIRNSAYEASTGLARERGPFPMFDAEKYLQGEFIRTLPGWLRDRIAAGGIRNAVLLSQAPTGTVSLLANVSSGIEPVFSFVTQRTDRTGTHVLRHPLVQEYLDQRPGEDLPPHFVVSRELTVEDHLQVQSTIQRYTDASISKTVVAPFESTVADVQALYRRAYDLGCKGVTFYRQGSRDAVLVDLEAEGRVTPSSGDVFADLGIPDPTVMRTRGKTLLGYTTSVQAPEGTTYVVVNSDQDGPLEVFIEVGRSGSDISALSEALGRLCSLVLRVPSPISPADRLGLMADQLLGLGGSTSVGFGPERVRSLPDAVGQVLANHDWAEYDTKEVRADYERLAGGMDLDEVAPPARAYKASGDLCPECGSLLLRAEGCSTCANCGYSKC